MVFCGLFPIDATDFEHLREEVAENEPERRQLLLPDSDHAASASVSAAVSWACCIWKSSPSGWRASPTSS